MRSERIKTMVAEDILDTLRTQGPMTSESLTVTLNARYRGMLSSRTVGQYLRRMQGCGEVSTVPTDGYCKATAWEAVQ